MADVEEVKQELQSEFLETEARSLLQAEPTLAAETNKGRFLKASAGLTVLAGACLAALWAWQPGPALELEKPDFIEDVSGCSKGGFELDWGRFSGSGPWQHPSLGQITAAGSGPLGRGPPVIGNAASEPALTFSNKGHTLTLSWQYAVSKLQIPYSDADFNEQITFSTNGKNTKIEAETPLGPTDTWDGVAKLSGSGNDRNDDTNDYTVISLKDSGGFNEVTMAHGNIWPRGVNGILSMKGYALCKSVPICPSPYQQLGGMGADVPGWGMSRRGNRASSKADCARQCDDNSKCGSFEFNGGQCALNAWDRSNTAAQTGNWAGCVTCAKPPPDYSRRRSKCRGSAGYQFKWADGMQSAELGTIRATGAGPLGNGQPVIGDAASQKALLFSNKAHTLVLSWDKKVRRMVIPYSDADFNEGITFSTNGGNTQITVDKTGPTDSWSSSTNTLSGSGNDDNTDPGDYTDVILEDTSGFNSVTMVHKSIWPRGKNAILDVEGCMAEASPKPTKPRPQPPSTGGGCIVLDWTISIKIKVSITVLIENVEFKNSLIQAISVQLGLSMDMITLDLFDVGGKLKTVFGISGGWSKSKLVKNKRLMKSKSFFTTFKRSITYYMKKMSVSRTIWRSCTFRTVIIKVSQFTSVTKMNLQINTVVKTFSLQEESSGGGAGQALVLTSGYTMIGRASQSKIFKMASKVLIVGMAKALKLKKSMIQVFLKARGGVLTTSFGISCGCAGSKANRLQALIQTGSWFETFNAYFMQKARMTFQFSGSISFEVTLFPSISLMVGKYSFFKFTTATKKTKTKAGKGGKRGKGGGAPKGGRLLRASSQRNDDDEHDFDIEDDEPLILQEDGEEEFAVFADGADLEDDAEEPDDKEEEDGEEVEQEDGQRADIDLPLTPRTFQGSLTATTQPL